MSKKPSPGDYSNPDWKHDKRYQHDMEDELAQYADREGQTSGEVDGLHAPEVAPVEERLQAILRKCEVFDDGWAGTFCGYCHYPRGLRGANHEAECELAAALASGQPEEV